MLTTQKLSVLLVDDKQRFRQGLRTLLNFYNSNGSLSLDIVGEAASQEQALKLTMQEHPDLILLDLELASGDGITFLLSLKDINYSGKVLVLSGHQEEDWIFRAMQAGAVGYVFKISVATQLYDAIKTLMNSQIYLPPEAASAFFRRFHANSESYLKVRQKFNLTSREEEVLHWLAQGASNEEIAQYLYVTVATVKAHLVSIFEKLQVNSRTQAIVVAIKQGLITTQLNY